MPFVATRVDLEIIILSKANGKEKDKYHMMSLICGISNTSEYIYETEIDTKT